MEYRLIDVKSIISGHLMINCFVITGKEEEAIRKQLKILEHPSQKG